MPDPHPLLSSLADPSPAVVADALRKVRFRDLKDPEVLGAVLACCADERPVEGTTANAPDPFAAFFDAAPKAAATIASIATERLEKAGIPEETASAERVAAVLHALPVAGPLGPAGARLLAQTKWPDPVAAVRAIVPALTRHDVPLFQVLVNLPSTILTEICGLAARPFRPRLFQELMNHSPSQDAAVAAVVAAVEGGEAGLDEGLAVTLLSTLVAWNRAEAPRVARALEPAHPLALAWRALDDPDARPLLREAIERGDLGDPGRFWPRLGEALRHREPLEGYPVATLLARTGTDPGVVAAWGVDDDVSAVLHAWVAALPSDPDRAWDAALQLAKADRLGTSRRLLESALTDGELPPFERGALTTLAALSPPLSGFVDACAAGVRREPDVLPDVVAACGALDDASVGRIADASLAVAEAAPRGVRRLSAKTVQEGPEGVPIDALDAWVDRLHPAARERFERVRSVVRAG